MSRPARSTRSGVRLWLLWPAFVVGLLAGEPQVRAGEAAPPFCRDAALDAEVTRAARNALGPAELLDLARRLNDPAAAGSACDGKAAFCVGQQLALGSVDRAYGLLDATPPDLEQAKAALDRGQSYGAPWQLLVALGDVDAALAHQSGEAALYGEAAGALQRALNAINEPPLCTAFGEVRPGPQDIQRIRKRAQEAVLLSPSFALTRTRSGECGGIFLSAVRGIEVESTPVPITFEFGKASFTPEGRKAADALLLCLKEKNLPSITLTGHTDSHGSDSYNMQLSSERLDAVQAYLRTGGFGGVLHLIPRGKREPFQPDDPTQHSADELDQMSRRVELRDVAP